MLTRIPLSLIFGGVAAGAAFLYWFVPQDMVASPKSEFAVSPVSSAPLIPSMARVTASIPLRATSNGGATTSATRKVASQSNSEPIPEWVRNPPELGLTRILSGDQAVFYEGRPRKVLGTKEVRAEGSNPEPVLLVRDESSGQIDYYQSGLLFRLQQGADMAAFIRERNPMKTQFSNADYATVLVDAGSIVSEFRALKNDPRVSYVAFLKPQARVTAR